MHCCSCSHFLPKTLEQSNFGGFCQNIFFRFRHLDEPSDGRSITAVFCFAYIYKVEKQGLHGSFSNVLHWRYKVMYTDQRRDTVSYGMTKFFPHSFNRLDCYDLFLCGCVSTFVCFWLEWLGYCVGWCKLCTNAVSM